MNNNLDNLKYKLITKYQLDKPKSRQSEKENSASSSRAKAYFKNVATRKSVTKIPNFKQQRPLGLANRSRATNRSQPQLERPKMQEESSNDSENLNEEDCENYRP